MRENAFTAGALLGVGPQWRSLERSSCLRVYCPVCRGRLSERFCAKNAVLSTKSSKSNYTVFACFFSISQCFITVALSLVGNHYLWLCAMKMCSDFSVRPSCIDQH